MLWLISLFTGYSPLGVSIGSVALSNLAIVPLYFFSKQLFGHRVALHSVLLYLFAPAVVLFTCTCADTLFTLFTASSLCFFVVAMERRSRLSAALAGLSFALATLMSFNLAILGAFFAVVGVTYLADREDRPDAVRCLSLMAGVFLAFYALAFVVARFDVVECFLKASRQVKTDLTNQDLYTPRAPFITWRFGTPIAVLCFAGIPATGLFALWVVRGPSANNSAPMARNSAAYYVGSLATLAVFDLLCFGKGEGERIWVFLLPLIIVPAAAMIARGTSKPSTVLVWTLGLTFLQTMVMEAVLFTYW
jgi:4-amino-4-deoxy-L-arabinose transferase-like glycosyltransferase